MVVGHGCWSGRVWLGGKCTEVWCAVEGGRGHQSEGPGIEMVVRCSCKQNRTNPNQNEKFSKV